MKLCSASSLLVWVFVYVVLNRALNANYKVVQITPLESVAYLDSNPVVVAVLIGLIANNAAYTYGAFSCPNAMFGTKTFAVLLSIFTVLLYGQALRRAVADIATAAAAKAAEAAEKKKCIEEFCPDGWSKECYHKQALIHHTDRNKEEGSLETMQRLNGCNQLLKEE